MHTCCYYLLVLLGFHESLYTYTSSYIQQSNRDYTNAMVCTTIILSLQFHYIYVCTSLWLQFTLYQFSNFQVSEIQQIHMHGIPKKIYVLYHNFIIVLPYCVLTFVCSVRMCILMYVYLGMYLYAYKLGEV